MPESTLKEVPLQDIHITDRFRRGTPNLDVLIQSISRNGLIHPIAVMEAATGGYILLAGGRRCAAAKHLSWRVIDAKVFPSDLSRHQMQQIELEENINREDMTWQEQVRLKQSIHDLRMEEHGARITRDVNAPGWSLRQTAAVFGEAYTTVQKDIELARAIDDMPELAHCKKKSHAMLRLSSIKESILTEEIARRGLEQAAKLAPSTSSNSLRDQLALSFRVGDCIPAMKDLESGTFDFIEVDPPYAIDLNAIKKGDSAANSMSQYNEVCGENFYSFMEEILLECYRLMSEGSWLVLWFAPDPWHEPMRHLLWEMGFQVRGLPNIWFKSPFAGQSLQPNIHLGSCYESFFAARKGQATLFNPGRNNVFVHAPVRPAAKIHPTEKPILLLRSILQCFCGKNSRILVPFAGSGNTLLASSFISNSTALGFDLSQEYRNKYITRLMSDTYDGECKSLGIQK